MTRRPRTTCARPLAGARPCRRFISRKSRKRRARSAVGEDQDVEVRVVQAGVGRDDPVARVVPRVADDGERGGVVRAVDLDLEPRELVAEELRERPSEDPGAAEVAFERQVHLAHDRASSPTPAHSRNGRSLAMAEPNDVRNPVEDQLLRVRQIERDAELQRQHVRRAAREDRERDVGADEPAARPPRSCRRRRRRRRRRGLSGQKRRGRSRSRGRGRVVGAFDELEAPSPAARSISALIRGARSRWPAVGL